jgi:cytochrome bd-type quinol oxidase subunit 2
MVSKIKKILTNLSIIGLFVAPLGAAVVAPMSVSAADECNGIYDCLDKGSSKTDENGADAASANDKVNGLIKTIINIFSLIVGVISVVMIIIGGLKYITSNGDSGNVTGAKNTILYAVIGLVIVVFAQLIVKFVLNKTQTAGS